MFFYCYAKRSCGSHDAQIPAKFYRCCEHLYVLCGLYLDAVRACVVRASRSKVKGKGKGKAAATAAPKPARDPLVRSTRLTLARAQRAVTKSWIKYLADCRCNGVNPSDPVTKLVTTADYLKLVLV